jgi:hypothetical protein
MKNALIAFSLSILVFGSCTKKDPVQYALTTSVVPVDGGTVSPSSGLYKEGESVVLTATPSAEYLFTGWSDGGSGTANPLTVVMNLKKSITANFEKRKYPLSITIEGNGRVNEAVVQLKSTTDYSSGTTVSLTAVPDIGWKFVGWSGNMATSELKIEVSVNKKIDLKMG